MEYNFSASPVPSFRNAPFRCCFCGSPLKNIMEVKALERAGLMKIIPIQSAEICHEIQTITSCLLSCPLSIAIGSSPSMVFQKSSCSAVFYFVQPVRPACAFCSSFCHYIESHVLKFLGVLCCLTLLKMHIL